MTTKLHTEWPVDEGPRPPKLVLAMVLATWQELLRHDEVIKARDFLERVPWFVDDDPAIERARKLTRSLLDKVSSNEALRAFYATHEATEAIPIRDDVPADWSQRPRFDFARAEMRRVLTARRERLEVRVLDVGCQDGWMTNRLAQEFPGADFIGVDQRAEHLELARRGAAVLGLRNASYVEGFWSELDVVMGRARGLPADIVLWFEAIEHEVDPGRALRRIAEAAADNATLLVSTPLGSWLGGAVLSDVRGNRIGGRWDEPREHVQAFTERRLRDVLERNCFTVEHTAVLPIAKPDHPLQATLVARAVRNVRPHP